jgi:delta-aminolevulinic acid dehydratase/porphobilinogen synthase
MVDPKLKSNYAEEAYNPNGLVPRAIKLIKKECPDVFVITDIALDPYSDQVRALLKTPFTTSTIDLLHYTMP